MLRWMVGLAVGALAFAPTALAGSAKASSELKDSEGQVHRASMAFDGLLQTGWGEGTEGDGGGEWLELNLGAVTEVTSVSIWPGNLSQGARSLREYGRPRTVTVTLAGGPQEITQTVRLPDGAEAGPKRVDVGLPGKGSTIKITIDDAFEGRVFRDTFIAEVAVNFAGGDNPKAVDQMGAWLETAAAKKAYDANKAGIVALFDKISGTEFGDRDALRKIMDQAGDGAPYMRARVNQLVPLGYRVQALPPDDVAIDALLKLKDANGIPALEMAALRVRGKDAQTLADKVEMFYAYQDLTGGGNANLPNWGQTGFQEGALRSFGEPMGVDMGAFGELYIADIGNHRIQRFDENGRVNKVWGGAPAITNVWFYEGRDYYPSGAEPGDKPGQFRHPVDIAMFPSKKEDRFVVLDAAGRVQIFDAEGRPELGWTVRSEDVISPGVGGEGYIGVSKGKIVVVWGNEVFVYNQSSEETRTWKIEDGVPNGLEILKNGKMAMIFGDELIQYSTDGFRHGRIIDTEDLGTGFEDWDIAIDEKGKLWAVTDAGRAVKFKGSGNVDYAVQVSDIDLIRPRLAVQDDRVYIVDRDRVLVVDALEINAKNELEEKKAKEKAKEQKKSGGAEDEGDG